MNPRLLRSASFALLLAACGDNGSTPDAAPPPADASTQDVTSSDITDVVTATDVAPEASTCTGTAPLCVTGMAGGQCGDAGRPATCDGGQWTCPMGTIPITACRCVGRPPGSSCTCGTSGWVCPDGGADAPVDATSDAGGCAGETPSCVAGEEGGVCSDALTLARCQNNRWTCQSGMVLTSTCRCIGRPPGRDCVCGASGWVCGADAGALDATTPDGGGVNCNPADVTCRALPPRCGSGDVPSVQGGCWGPCVRFGLCAPIPCTPGGPEMQCPANTACYTTRRTCGELVR